VFLAATLQKWWRSWITSTGVVPPCRPPFTTPRPTPPTGRTPPPSPTTGPPLLPMNRRCHAASATAARGAVNRAVFGRAPSLDRAAWGVWRDDRDSGHATGAAVTGRTDNGGGTAGRGDCRMPWRRPRRRRHRCPPWPVAFETENGATHKQCSAVQLTADRLLMPPDRLSGRGEQDFFFTCDGGTPVDGANRHLRRAPRPPAGGRSAPCPSPAQRSPTTRSCAWVTPPAPCCPVGSSSASPRRVPPGAWPLTAYASTSPPPPSAPSRSRGAGTSMCPSTSTSPDQ
jgi:hypothetical protein